MTTLTIEQVVQDYILNNPEKVLNMVKVSLEKSQNDPSKLSSATPPWGRPVDQQDSVSNEKPKRIYKKKSPIKPIFESVKALPQNQQEINQVQQVQKTSSNTNDLDEVSFLNERIKFLETNSYDRPKFNLSSVFME